MTEHGFCPFATVRNIPPGSNDPAIVPRLAILHVDAGNAESLFNFFNGPSGGVESHFFVKKTGEIEQYRSIYFQADANLDANDFAVSIETQGFGVGVWNTAQLRSIKRLLTWLHTEAQIPLRKVQNWDGSGVGYHVMFGAPGHWTPSVKTCPGPDRIKQFDDLLVPWMRKVSRGRIKRTRVLVVNAKSGSNPRLPAFVNWIKRRRRAYPVFVSEAKRVDLSPAGFVAQSHTGTKGHQENAIVTRECALEVEFIKLTEDFGTPISPDRCAVRAVMAGRRVFYAIHANAVIQDMETRQLRDSPGARAWAHKGLPKLAKHIRADIDAGYAVIAGGDMNWRGVDPVPGSPAATFAALGMSYVNEELLGVAFTPEYTLGRKLPILGPPVKRLPNPPGSDHAALSVRLIRRR